MLPLYSIRVAELPPVWERAVHSFLPRVSLANVLCQFVCVRVSFPLSFYGRIWDLIVLVPDHCLSFTLLESWPHDYR